MDRVYFSYDKWEDWHYGMWRNVYGLERNRLLGKAVEFTGNACKYGSFMLKVIREWPYSCLHNLSNVSMNRQAWIGHAACCLAINCPEDITRLAWHKLTQQQQDEANEQANKAIEQWEAQYYKGIQLCLSII
jgi:hypothetical protein